MLRSALLVLLVVPSAMAMQSGESALYLLLNNYSM